MVKSKDDYERRQDDSRFKKFDQLIDPTSNDKQYIILVIGISLMFCLLSAPFLLKLVSEPDPVALTNNEYEKGLNISYIPKDKVVSISFTNPNNDTLAMATSIKIPFDTQTAIPTYMTVYESTATKFPSTINYTPSEKISEINHFVMVTLIKESGNYSYVYTVSPQTENKMWDGVGKYINGISNIFIKNETN